MWLEELDDRRLLAVIAHDLYQSTLHDQPLSSYVSGHDDQGGNVTFQATTCPANGSLTFAADGSFVFTPTAGRSGLGLASFTFVATNGSDSDTGTATIEVYNTVPEAYDGSATVVYGQSNPLYLYGWDLDGDAVTFSEVTSPANGSLTLNGDGSYSYEPDFAYDGTDSFVFSVSDGLDSATAEMTIVVLNTAPEAAPDLYDVDLTPGAPPTAGNVLGNDMDPDGNLLSAILVSTPSHGSLLDEYGVALQPGDFFNGDFQYLPDSNWPGNDGFEYRSSDGAASSAPTFAAFQAPNLPVVSVAGDARLENNGTLSFTVTVTVPNGAPLTNNVSFAYATGADTTTNANPATPGPNAPDDYVAASGTYTFTPNGPLTTTVTVTIHNDPVPEPNETFRLNLSNIVGGTANNPADPIDTTKTHAIGTVLNNDVKIIMLNATIVEALTSLPVKMYVEGANAITSNGLEVKLLGKTFDGTAKVANGDYKEVPEEAFNVVGGANNEQVAERVKIYDNDEDPENDEYFGFFVKLDSQNTSANAEVNISTNSAKLTIKEM